MSILAAFCERTAHGAVQTLKSRNLIFSSDENHELYHQKMDEHPVVSGRFTQDATQAAKANVAAAATWLAAQGSQVLVRQARNCQADVCGVVGGFLKGNPYSNMMVYDMNSGNSLVLRWHLDGI